MQIVADEGYHAATHQRIAQVAGLVRSAINYHFPDQTSLLDGLVGHLHRLKSARVKAAIPPLSAEGHPGLAIDAYWDLLQETPFVAFAELECCARTDEPLRMRLAAAQRLSTHGEAEGWPPASQQAPSHLGEGFHDLSRCLLEGMARGGITREKAILAQRALDLLKHAAPVGG